jgi:sorbitol-specific phosphotransferase system component IIBC
METPSISDAKHMADKGNRDLEHDAMQNLIQKISERRERLLAMAFHAGYDGVDVVSESGMTNHVMEEDFKLGFEWEAWEGEAPRRDRFEQVMRYDFRQLTDEEEQRLLAKIGVYE